jgi:putative restriction endonuclease
VRTVFPRSGAKVWYDDQREVHRQIYEGDESVDYAFMGDNPDAADNRWLRDAMDNRVPVIYFLGVSPGRYHAIVPTFIIGWDATALKAQLAFGLPGQTDLDPARLTAIQQPAAASNEGGWMRGSVSSCGRLARRNVYGFQGHAEG